MTKAQIRMSDVQKAFLAATEPAAPVYIEILWENETQAEVHADFVFVVPKECVVNREDEAR